MARIIIGILLILFGLGSCFCGPMVPIFNQMLQDREYFSSQDVHELKIDESGAYQLYLVTSGVIDGVSVNTSPNDLPQGQYGFMADDGTMVPLNMADGTATLTINNVEMVVVGDAALDPGKYTVVTPPGDTPFYMCVLAFEFADIGLYFIGGSILMIVCLIAGIVLIVSGARQSGRKKREAAMAWEQPAYQDEDTFNPYQQ